MSQENYGKLNRFFSPFLEVLSVVTNTNLTHWILQEVSLFCESFCIHYSHNLMYLLYQASQYRSSGNSSDLFTEWFELEDELKEAREIVSTAEKASGVIGWRQQLLRMLIPKKNNADERNGYNTTIGMLTMF